MDTPRERRIVALSGLAPDIDVLAYVAAIVWFGFDKDLAYEHVWSVFHHKYTHGLGFIVLTGIVAYGVARVRVERGRAVAIAACSMFASVVHVFCDVVGGGPTWPVYPLWPLSDLGWSVSWSWTLADWPNHVILFASLAGTILYARIAGYSPLESISYRLDSWFVGVARQDVAAPHRAVGAVSGSRAKRLRLLIYAVLALLVAAVLIPLGVTR